MRVWVRVRLRVRLRLRLQLWVRARDHLYSLQPLHLKPKHGQILILFGDGSRPSPSVAVQAAHDAEDELLHLWNRDPLGSDGDGMRWYAVVCVGMRWYALVCGGMRWYAVVCGGISLYLACGVSPLAVKIRWRKASAASEKWYLPRAANYVAGINSGRWVPPLDPSWCGPPVRSQLMRASGSIPADAARALASRLTL